ncbi:chitinase C-terminal domain-containing protein [Endozoicomonas euniceicola]|uniref:Chitinase C-terminal domain-containing protein n=1 Tax=Endozoicomonas euniceicola TaxID=1234143 RepID=A0ABY6GX42_9GAMM|nr:chitinase C-terminal domain-containing protein [Endozoicomonas euniceicola]UYM17132.1 chitinase C-terminal domain-containing protein [Endozoicomonas euniceicola]
MPSGRPVSNAWCHPCLLHHLRRAGAGKNGIRGHPRRIIGYFTSWHNGANGQPAYQVNNIPWDKLTHINYAFAHVDSNNRISVADQSGFKLEVVDSGANASGNNIGGLNKEFHRVAFSLPAWQNLGHGASVELTLNYYLPITGPQAWTVNINGTDYALKSEYPELPLADLSNGGGESGGGENGGGQQCSAAGIDTAGLNAYPNWPNGSNANGDDQIIHNGGVYKAKWWTTSEPGSDESWAFVCTL